LCFFCIIWFLFGCQYQCNRLPGKSLPQNNLLCFCCVSSRTLSSTYLFTCAGAIGVYKEKAHLINFHWRYQLVAASQNNEQFECCLISSMLAQTVVSTRTDISHWFKTSSSVCQNTKSLISFCCFMDHFST